MPPEGAEGLRNSFASLREEAEPETSEGTTDSGSAATSDVVEETKRYAQASLRQLAVLRRLLLVVVVVILTTWLIHSLFVVIGLPVMAGVVPAVAALVVTVSTPLGLR